MPRSWLAAFMIGVVVSGGGSVMARADENVRLTGVPDYQWQFGCFGTATGNLIGFWDRHGLPDFYTGPTGGGQAPMDSFGSNAGIRALWASEAGVDGRPANLPGHAEDYWIQYESPAPDPYVTAGRAEHAPDCVGDFIGLNQHKWPVLGGECAGNIDAYSFNFFDPEGGRRTNYTPADPVDAPIPDLQSGLRAWAEFRGYGADSFSQLTDFNPNVSTGRGFTFEDMKAEIEAGYPVLLFMQAFDQLSRTVQGVPGLNPVIHGMLAYGYLTDDSGNQYVRYRTSWASGDNQFSLWNAESWTPEGQLNLPLRGVIGFRPRPKLLGIEVAAGLVRLRWHGPLATLRDELTELERPAHWYVVERAVALDAPDWQVVAGPVAELSAEVPDEGGGAAFFRVRLATAPGSVSRL